MVGSFLAVNGEEISQAKFALILILKQKVDISSSERAAGRCAMTSLHKEAL